MGSGHLDFFQKLYIELTCFETKEKTSLQQIAQNNNYKTHNKSYRILRWNNHLLLRLWTSAIGTKRQDCLTHNHSISTVTNKHRRTFTIDLCLSGNESVKINRKHIVNTGWCPNHKPKSKAKTLWKLTN